MKKSSLVTDLIYNDLKPAISVLFETETTKEIRIVFKKGQVMKEHKTGFPITVEIFDGEIEFGVNSVNYSLKKGDLVSLDANVPHNLLAKTNSIVRLTLSKLVSVDRVIKVSES